MKSIGKPGNGRALSLDHVAKATISAARVFSLGNSVGTLLSLFFPVRDALSGGCEVSFPLLYIALQDEAILYPGVLFHSSVWVSHQGHSP